MYKLISDKNYFAIEVDVTADKWDNGTCLWFNGIRVGNWEDRNLLAPFERSLRRIVESPEKIQSDRMEELSCRELYLLLYPFFELKEISII